MKKTITGLMATAAIAFAAPALAAHHEGGDHADMDHAAMAEEGAMFTLETPIADIAANEDGRAILEKNMPGLLDHAMYATFSNMGLSMVASMSGGQISAEALEMTKTDLAAIEAE